jgi:FixJ family two-component response regulator
VTDTAEDAIAYIVDDDAAVRDSLKILLESHGLRVEDFATAHDFAEGYRPGHCAVLVLDQDLPMTTGLDFLERAGSLDRDLPVILVTGRGDSAVEARALGAGVAAYFEKPLAAAQLVTTILRVLDRQRAAAG